MKKTKAVSLLLSLSLLATLAIPGTLAQSVQADTTQENKGMVINKTAEANDDGTYTITLEAYATGSKIISETKKDIPTDIVLVLDQSGSMDDPIGEVSFAAYTKGNRYNYTTNSHHYSVRHNGGSANLYYPIGDGAYASVSVAVEQKLSYRKITDGKNNSTGVWGGSSTNYWNNQSNLYAIMGGQYVKVTVTREQVGESWYNPYEYTYKLPDNTVIATSRGDSTAPTFSGTDDNVLYLAEVDDSQNVYTYTYMDSNGAVQTIGTSTGADTEFTTTLYERVITSSGKTKLQALKDAANLFISSVSEKAKGANGIAGDADDVDHRIAVVGFASTGSNYTNTELLSTSNVVNYRNAANSNYKDALVSVNDTNGSLNTRLTNAIKRLDASGDTYLQYGMDMANKIFDQYPITEDDTTGRQRVVIVFTDGYPAPSGTDDFNYSMADAAIANASTTKSSYNAAVYTVAVLADADPQASIVDGYFYGGLDTQEQTVASNRYMHYVSSNYPDATSMSAGGTLNPKANPFNGGDSYYLSASDANTLNGIFQQISDNIESGGSSTTLSSETIIRDIIAPAFTLPDGADASDIVLETYPCTGVGTDGKYTWDEKNADAMGAKVTIGSTDNTEEITTNNQVNVTGFDFAGNYVGTVTENGNTTYRGNKLVIKITVEPREGFFGGNGVDTNTSAGVYENANATDPVLTFPKPDVNVPLAEPTVVVPDANVYLGAYYSQTVPEDAVKMGATVTIAGYDIDFSKADDPDHPYGLEPWQVEYVNISIAATTEGNNGSFENIQEDITYTVTVTVSPKTPGPSGDETATDTVEGTIHVFKPCLTYQDSQVWYGGDAPTDFNGNLTEETWINSDGSKKHDDEDVQMLNTKPELTLSYTPEAGKIATDGKVNTKKDIGVNATVKIGENDVLAHTTFKHTSCGEDCGWDIEKSNGSPAFLLHVNTCQLTISKTGGAPDEPYVFTVYRDGREYSEITIVGNNRETIYELPVGTYTIKEDTGWSWRYAAGDNGSAALTAYAPNGSIACSNSKTENYWLNGFSDVVKNIFGIKN